MTKTQNPVTAKQLQFIGQLMNERADETIRECETKAGLDPDNYALADLPSRQASALIDALLDTPKSHPAKQPVVAPRIPKADEVPHITDPTDHTQTLVGQRFVIGVADGLAKYEVTADDGEFVTVEHVPDERMFDYKSAILDDECRVSRENVKRFIDTRGRVS